MKKLVMLFLLVSVVTVVSGCETIRGLAQDIENTGDNLWEAMNRK